MDIVIIWSPIVKENKMYPLAQELFNHLFLILHPQATVRMSPLTVFFHLESGDMLLA